MNDSWDYINDLVAAFEQIQSDAGKLRKEHPELRRGQAIYVIAQKKFPSFVKNVPQDDDCFYVDDKIDSFLAAVSRQISEQSR